MVVNLLLLETNGEEVEMLILEEVVSEVAGRLLLKLDGKELKLLMLEDRGVVTLIVGLNGPLEYAEGDELMLGGPLELRDELSLLLGAKDELDEIELLPPVCDEGDNEIELDGLAELSEDELDKGPRLLLPS